VRFRDDFQIQPKPNSILLYHHHMEETEAAMPPRASLSEKYNHNTTYIT